MESMLDINGCNILARHIIMQAVKDYRYAYKKLKKKNLDIADKMKYEGICDEVKLFFLSQYFSSFVDLDGERLFRLMKEEIDNEYKK